MTQKLLEWTINGYSLLEVYAVLKVNDDTYDFRMLEGRTRNRFFGSQDIEYIIVDVYEHVDETQGILTLHFTCNN